MDYQRIAQLVEKVQQNNSSAFEELYSITYQKFYYFALTILHNEYDVQDILQDVYMQILQSIHVLKNNTAFIAWAERIIYHACIKFKNRQMEIPTDDAAIDIPEDASGNPLKCLENQELSQTLFRMIYELDPIFRTTVYLRYVEQLKLSEIAEIMDCPVGTVKSRLHLAKKQLYKAAMASERKGVLLYSIWFFPFSMALHQIPYMLPHDPEKAGNILQILSKQQWDANLTYHPQSGINTNQIPARLVQMAGIPVIGAGLVVAGAAVSISPSAPHIVSLETSLPYVRQATVSISLSGIVGVTQIALKDNGDGTTVAACPANGTRYQFTVFHNGNYILEALNDESVLDSVSFQIDSIDSDEPFIMDYSYDLGSDTLEIRVKDADAGIDYSQIAALSSSGHAIFPKSVNVADGTLYYSIPEDNFILSLTDLVGNNSEHLVKADPIK